MAAILEAPAQQTMADTVAVVARRVDEHEEHLCALQHAVDAQQRRRLAFVKICSEEDPRMRRLRHEVEPDTHLLWINPRYTFPQDLRSSFAALARGLALGRVAGKQSAPLALVALHRQQAVGEELGLLRCEVAALPRSHG